MEPFVIKIKIERGYSNITGEKTSRPKRLPKPAAVSNMDPDIMVSRINSNTPVSGMSAAVSKLKNQVVISALNADVTIKAGISNASTSGIADNSSVMMQTNVGAKITSNTPLSQQLYSQLNATKMGTVIRVYKFSDIATQTHTVGNKQYELTNHLGNVLTVISDYKKRVDDQGSNYHFEADVLSSQDYYPFGMGMNGRSYQNNQYRFGFNGMPKMDELTGVVGKHVDFGARGYNAITGRWNKVEPLRSLYPGLSTYAFAANKPIKFIDPDGRKIIPVGTAAQYIARLRQSNDPTIQNRIKKLDESAVEYFININTVDQDFGGTTAFDFDYAALTNKLSVDITIGIPSDNCQDEWAFNSLGDELKTAEQFEDAEIGWALNSDKKVIPLGYSWNKEVATKKASVITASSLSVDRISSSKSYEENVMNKGMSEHDWIKKYERDDGASYNTIIGKTGMRTKLKQYQLGDGRIISNVWKEKNEIKSFIYRISKSGNFNFDGNKVQPQKEAEQTESYHNVRQL